MAVTLRDIAEVCGVSSMTVSRVLNGKDSGKVSAILRERILSVAQELDYQPNPAARQLKYAGIISESPSSVPTVTMLIPQYGFLDSTNPNSSSETLLEVFNGALAASAECGVQLVTQPVSQSNQPCSIDWSWLSRLDSNSLILAPAPWFMFCLLELSRRGCRIALLSQNGFWPNVFSRYVSDWFLLSYHYQESARFLTDYLLDAGYGRVAFATFRRYLEEPDFPLLDGYEQGLRGRCKRQVIAVESAESACEDISQAYVQRPFDALVLCPVNISTLNYTQSLPENYGLPQKVCIVSTTDQADFCRLSPQISAMRYPFRQMGYDATKALLDDNFRAGVRWYEGQFQRRGQLAETKKKAQPAVALAQLA